MNTVLLVGGVILIVGGIYKLFLSKSKVPAQVAKLQVQAGQVQQQITTNDAERATLKETVTAEQSNATEEQKSEFWTQELGDKK